MSKEINLEPKKKLKLLGGSHIVGDIGSGAKLTGNLTNLSVTGILSPQSIVDVTEGNVELSEEARILGGSLLVNKGTLTINVPVIPRDSDIQASKVEIGRKVRILCEDMRAGTLIFQEGGVIFSGTTVEESNKIFIRSGVAIHGGIEDRPTSLFAESEITIRPGISFHMTPEKPEIRIEGRKGIKAAGVHFHGGNHLLRLESAGSIVAGSIVNCSTVLAGELAADDVSHSNLIVQGLLRTATIGGGANVEARVVEAENIGVCNIKAGTVITSAIGPARIETTVLIIDKDENGHIKIHKDANIIAEEIYSRENTASGVKPTLIAERWPRSMGRER